MSHFLDRLKFFNKTTSTFSNGHGAVVNEDRTWENTYRQRWQHDKIVRSTHGVNCTGSCSWKVYVKNGLITWETQQTDYPRTRPDLPNHEPRGCPRGASYSWYVYSAQRVKYPMVRGRLMEMWREARKTMDPVTAWDYISQNPERAARYKSIRGLGGFVRATWDESNEIIAAANALTIKKYGPDRIVGFSPIPAMSMVSYAAGTRYLSLIGGVALSFYDWYCDLPPASPQVWGEQTDVPESADWYNSTFLMVWGSNVPMTRTPDAHFYTEVRYKGTKTVAVSSDFGEMAKFGDIWLAPKQGTDAALAMAMGHVILNEYHSAHQSKYFKDYAKQYTDFPMLVLLKEQNGILAPEYFLRASHLADNLDETNNPDWKTLVIDEASGRIVAPAGSIGFRWGESGKWNLEMKEGGNNAPVDPQLSLIGCSDEVMAIGFPYFGGKDASDVLMRNVPVKRITLADGSSALVATVFDLTLANYGIDRGLGGGNVATSYDDDVPYTPAWQVKHTGVKAADVVTVARQFAQNADQTRGKSMVIVGAALNHWYHMDMTYRGIINMLMMCGCVGQSGGGWAHYVGQEKLRPQTGWTPLAFAQDWNRPMRQMNGTSFFYAHTSQWRHEKLHTEEISSPTAGPDVAPMTLLDYNAKAERMGWLPSAPQLQTNPLEVTRAAAAAGMDAADYAVDQIRNKKLEFSCDDPDNPANFPRNMFVWRSNILGSSGKGHEYFLKYLLGTQNALMSNEDDCIKPRDVKVRPAAEGKLDLLVVLDFRMSTTCLYGDIVLPTATWYEKDDLNTSDMHPFIHPLSEAVQPLWQSKSDWDIYKGIAKKFEEIGGAYLGTQQDLVLTPLMHDTPGELGQPFDPKDWRAGECEPIPGKTMPNFTVVERDYTQIYQKFTSIGPLLEKIGNGPIGADARRGARPAAPGHGDRRRRDDPVAGAGNQRPRGGQGLGGAVGHDRPRPHAPGAAAPARHDPLPRRASAAAQNHLVADLVGAGVGGGQLQRLLHQRARTDPVAHADRPPAVLPGSPLDARFWRGLVRLQARHQHQDHDGDAGRAAERQHRTGAELHHAAPEVGHPLDVFGQPAHADLVARRSPRVAVGNRRQGRRHRRQRLDRSVQRQRHLDRPRRRQPARAGRHDDDVPRAGKDHQHAGRRTVGQARRHPQLGHAGGHQADPHDRRLRAAVVGLQLLRHGRLQPR
jgi:nitrate reductase alpha subunit